MKIDLPIWIRALREEFNHSSFVEEVIVFFNSHLPCTCCKTIKRDEDFHKGSSPARRHRYPICKDCTKQTKNKKGASDSAEEEYLEEAFEE